VLINADTPEVHALYRRLGNEVCRSTCRRKRRAINSARARGGGWNDVELLNKHPSERREVEDASFDFGSAASAQDANGEASYRTSNRSAGASSKWDCAGFDVNGTLAVAMGKLHQPGGAAHVELRDS
jgi:hypothetical protein